jgi:hypothetical protein
MITLSMGKISHLGHMVIPDHPAESRQVRITHKDDSTVIPTPYELALFRLEIIFTEYAIGHVKNVNENGT